MENNTIGKLTYIDQVERDHIVDMIDESLEQGRSLSIMLLVQYDLIVLGPSENVYDLAQTFGEIHILQ